MYKVSYYLNNSSRVAFKWFQSFTDAVDFSIKQPRESILEIKLYDNEASNIKDNTNING